MRVHSKLLWLLFTVFFVGCHKEKPNFPFQNLTLSQFDSLRIEDYQFNESKIREYIDSFRLANRDTAYIDYKVNSYYAKRGPYLWIDKMGLDNRCDSLIPKLIGTSSTGLRSQMFYTLLLQENIERLRTLDFSKRNNVNAVMARLEYYLTKAYMRYANGQRFGFINPGKLFNFMDLIDPEDSLSTHYRVLYDIKQETANQDFFNTAINSLSNGRYAEFLNEIEPTDSLYYRFVRELQRPNLTKEQKERLTVSIERSRWRIKHEQYDKYIQVNIPSFMLYAFDKKENTVLSMRICCGSRKHKTPLLNSNIQRLELNPKWTVPQSIIKKEIALKHAGDPDYFERNRMIIISRTTKEEISPEYVTPDMLKSGQYIVQQEQGEGNSLGRLIFRFPNNFAIYMHDTPNKNAFNSTWRGVSHGCIRLEKPLDLAIFLLDEKDPVLTDRFRVAIDLPALTAEGKALTGKDGYKNIGLRTYKPEIPLFINYFTAYPNLSGTMEYFPDVYGYDAAIIKRLKTY